MLTFAYPVNPANGHDLDLAAPVIVCDHCHEIITDDAPGNLLWHPANPRRTWHVHRKCDLAFDKAHPHLSVRFMYSRGLYEWVAQLHHNYADPITRPQDLGWSDGADGVERFHVTRWRPDLRRCASCGDPVQPGHRFCAVCAPMEAAAAAGALASRDRLGRVE